MGDLAGPYLPAPDRPVRVDQDGLGVDPATGVLIAPDGNVRDRRYRVTSAVPRRTAQDLRAARQVRRTGGAPPRLPADLRRRAEAITAGAATSFGKPAALLRHFEDPSNGFTTATTEPPGGHGYFALRKLFERPRSGTDEQYASAIAVFSRALGYESRVAAGSLTLGGPQAAASAPSVTRTIPVPRTRSSWPSTPPRGPPTQPRSAQAGSTSSAGPPGGSPGTVPSPSAYAIGVDPGPHLRYVASYSGNQVARVDGISGVTVGRVAVGALNPVLRGVPVDPVLPSPT